MIYTSLLPNIMVAQILLQKSPPWTKILGIPNSEAQCACRSVASAAPPGTGRLGHQQLQGYSSRWVCPTRGIHPNRMLFWRGNEDQPSFRMINEFTIDYHCRSLHSDKLDVVVFPLETMETQQKCLFQEEIENPLLNPLWMSHLLATSDKNGQVFWGMVEMVRWMGSMHSEIDLDTAFY